MSVICTPIILESNLRLLDSINRPEDVVKYAQEIGLAGVCVTEHESVGSYVAFDKIHQKLIQEGSSFKIGFGNEIYLTDNRESGQKYWHFILIAKNAVGAKMLRELSSIAWENSYFDRGMERVPTLKSDLAAIVQKYGKGNLIASSACLGSEIDHCILQMHEAEQNNDLQMKKQYYDNLFKMINYCLDLFGDDFYLEVQPAQSREQLIVNRKMKSIADYFGIKIIVTTDAHYLKKEDREVHKAYLNSKGGEREVDEFYAAAYLQTTDEVIVNLEGTGLDYNELEANTLEIYNKIENYSFARKQKVPQVEVPDYPKVSSSLGYPTLDYLYNSDDPQERYWVNYCVDKLKEISKYNDTYLSRLEEEADIKRTIGETLDTCIFAYPIFLQHYIDLFWECGSTVGAGRGSACSGLNHYLLGVTQLDPIEHSLPFWRYLNKSRVDELPDIDIDLCPSKREFIFEKIREERGKYGCVQVCTYGTETTKSAIKTACFKEGSLVKTLNGDKPIEQINSQDYVYTTNGWEQVITPTYETERSVIFLKNRNSVDQNITCTPDHELFVCEKDPKHRGRIKGSFQRDLIDTLLPEFKEYKSKTKIYERFYSYGKQISPIWVQAKDINSNVFGLTKLDLTINNIKTINWVNNFKRQYGIDINEHININEDFCELLGMWLAEGGIYGRNTGITFTIHKKETIFKNRIVELMYKVFGLDNPNFYERQDSQALVIQYGNKQLVNFLYQLFDVNTSQEINQWNKHIPKMLLHINPSLQLQIFKGWFIGDGYARCTKENNESKGTTVSYQLAKDMVFILRRNFINPYVQIEERSQRKKTYNIFLYSQKAKVLYNMKYCSDYKSKFYFNIECHQEMDIPVFINGEVYLKNKIELLSINEAVEQKVYCLQVPSQNFTLQDIIVHNCRGYRSKDCPDGIDIDIAEYMSSLIPQERGFLWDLSDVVNGNFEKDRKPVKKFLDEVNQYPGLLDIMLSIEGSNWPITPFPVYHWGL